VSNEPNEKGPQLSPNGASREAMMELQDALVKALAKRIADGTATAADLSVASGLLKANGILPGARSMKEPRKNLANVLPFRTEDPEGEHRQSVTGAG